MDHPTITIEEYEKTRTVEEYLDWIEYYKKVLIRENEAAAIESIERKSIVGKKMFEEAHPIATYCRITQVEKIRSIQLHAGSQNFDGHISGMQGLDEYLEVTQAIDQQGHRKRKELAETGCYMSQSLTMFDDLADNAIERTIAIVKKKCSKNYPVNTSLIVAIDDDFILDDTRIFTTYLNKLPTVWDTSKFSKLFVCSHNGNHSKLFQST